MSETATRRWLAATGLLLVVALAVAALTQRRPTLVTLPRAPIVASRSRPVAPAVRGAARRGQLHRALPHHGRNGRKRRAPARLPPRALPVADAAMPVVGPPSVAPALIDATLAREGSPLAGLGSYVYREGRRWRVDPAFLLAFVSYFDVGSALPQTAHNVGHIRAPAGQPAVDGYRAYPSWRSGVDAWYRLIGNLYVRRWGLRTLESIIPVYAPGSGRRSVEAELNAMRDMVSAWRMESGS